MQEATTSAKTGDFNEFYHQQYQEVVRQDDGVERAHALTEIVYKPGFENKIAIFPGTEGLPINIAFSWGKDAPNMSTVVYDKSEGSQESEETGQRNTAALLEDSGFTGFPNVIQVLGKFEGLEPQIEEISKETIRETSRIVGNFVFTRDKDVTLIIKPGDCPVAIIYCEDGDGNDIVAIDHSGRQAANAGMSFQGAMYLQDELGVDLSNAYAFIVPGAGRKSFWISNEPERWPNSLVERNWGKYIDERLEDVQNANYERHPESGNQKRYVDIGRATVMQLVKAGFTPENIEYYDVDSYEAARRGESFSERFSSENRDGKGNRLREGRFVVAVQLRPKIKLAQDINGLPMAA